MFDQAQYNKDYYQKNQERLKKKSRQYYADNTEKAKAAVKRYRHGNIEQKLIVYKRQAATRKYTWNLPDSLAVDLLTDNCFYCGQQPDPLNGIDRVDNCRGYEEDNVVTACGFCNFAKSTQSRKDFEAWVVRAATHITNHGSI